MGFVRWLSPPRARGAERKRLGELKAENAWALYVRGRITAQESIKVELAGSSKRLARHLSLLGQAETPGRERRSSAAKKPAD
jgi:hypothetical protein